MLQTHLVFSRPQPWSQPFLQGALLPLIREWYLGAKTWGLDVLIPAGVSPLLGPPGEDRTGFVLTKFPLLPIVGPAGSSR